MPHDRAHAVYPVEILASFIFLIQATALSGRILLKTLTAFHNWVSLSTRKNYTYMPGIIFARTTLDSFARPNVVYDIAQFMSVIANGGT